MPDGNTLVLGVIGVGGTMFHGKGRDLLRVAEKDDTLPRMWSVTCRRFDDGEQTSYALDGAVNLLERVSGHSDGTSSTVIWCQFTKGHVSVPMPFSCMTRVLADL